MNLYRLLQQRVAAGNPVRVGLIGAGKFGSMYLSQIPRTPGIHVLAVADLDPARAEQALVRVGWHQAQYAADNFKQAFASGTTHITDDAMALIRNRHVEVIIDATGDPAAGIAHALACCENRKHIIMVNVEADALAGPLLARRAAEAGVVYSLAYGDQPALICEMVDWARTAGFEVVAAGKGSRYLPAYHASTPDTVWGYYGFSEETVAVGDFNARVFNSFLDGTRSAIDMAAVANATGLTPAPRGLEFPPCGADDLAHVLRPRADGGHLHHRGQVEVISSLERDGRPVFRDLRQGLFVTVAADADYVRRSFGEYGLVTDDSGNYAAMYKPFRLAGLELGISVASVAVRGEPTGVPTAWHADCVAVAKRELKAGEILDGEGGYTVYGKLMPAAVSRRLGGLPVGLANNVKLLRNIAAGKPVTWEDVAIEAKGQAVKVRREMEKMFSP